MLKKLLKYDFAAVFKYWWIAALTAAATSVASGFCIKLLIAKNIPIALSVFAVIFLVVDFAALVAFSIVSYVLVFARMYKNFFTDEGYLTFTLPVKRTSLLNSKIIMASVTQLLTTCVIMFGIFLTVIIGVSSELLESEVFFVIRELVFDFPDDIKAYLPLYITEGVILSVALVVMSILFLTACITLGSIIVKKAKVITSIGIYYVVNSLFTSVVQFIYMLGLSYLTEWLSESNMCGMIGVLLFGAIALVLLLSVLLYTFVYWLIDRKLNLA